MTQVLQSVRFFKSDISLADKESCVKYSNWNENLNTCGFYDNDIIIETCCYAMRGDTSATPYFFSPFNNTYDFVDFISQEKNRYLFDKDTKIERYQQAIIWQFDIQNGEAFNPILEEFLYSVLKAINDLNLNIKMQWSSGIINQYQQICEEQQCNQKQKFIANQPVLAYSASYSRVPTNFYDVINPQNKDQSLIQILNVPLTDLADACENGVNGWFSEFDHPVIFWEPSFEYSTQYVYQYWYSKNCKKPKNYDRLKNPLSTACNQQPEMQNVYIQLNNKTLYNEDKYGQKTLFKDIKETVLAYQEDGEIFYMAYQKLDSQGKTNQASQDIFIAQIVKNDKNDLYLQIIDFQNQGKIVKEINLGNKDFYDFENILDTELIFKSLNDQQKIQGLFTYNDQQFVKNTYIQKMYAISFDIPYDGEIIISGPNQIGYGARPRGNIYQYKNKNYITLTYGNSTCQVGSTMNNNGWNKCNIYEQEQLLNLVNVEYMLSYMYGQFDSFNDRIKNGNIITGCDEEILVGKYNNGINPTIILKQFDGYLRAFVGHDYVSYLDLGWASNIMCGTGYYDKEYQTQQAGFVYQFQVVEFSSLDYGIEQNKKYELKSEQDKQKQKLQIEL
ncbi:hypothetical protein PPERSA_09272 [Pseudocohnilembus persalinus]|uniref:Uncharacterized protein n=1 Tax=Pseudocohnilembus persalinus TaxID=266149 RepID=A0A0V0QMA9_PSEPJ|nr:hypothetical protein PPERSA_09272 [Pseudocohnilembus persalinus]|eukprot:KRX03260.1 hypothetical protein PPERSA_09272 [Pseudocohnilembus persalinus]